MGEIILGLVLALHLMSVNVASAGPLVCLWLEWKEARHDRLAGQIGRFIAWTSLAMLLVGGVLGLVMGSLLWDDEYRALLARFPSKIYFAIWEFVFSLVLMLAHSIWWTRWVKPSRLLHKVRMLLPLLSGSNLLYHFPFLFVVISDVGSQRMNPPDIVDAAVFRSLIVDSSVLARVAHFVMAAFAVTGVVMVCWSLWRMRFERESKDAARVAIWGARLALVPTLAQIPIGLWLIAQLPSDVQHRLLGADVAVTSLLLISIVVALALMHQLSAAALGDTRRGTLVKVVFTMVIVIILMTAVLQRIR